jgi:hypothetical protein
MMQKDAADLKARYAQTLDEALATVESLDEADLRRRSPENQCSVAALVAHIALVHKNVAGWVQMLVAGEALPQITMADIDRGNAEQAALNDDLGKDDLLQRLRTSGATLTSVLSGLSDQDMSRSGRFTLFGGDANVQALVEMAVINHTAEHLASVRSAVAPETASRA